jgi:hypothetical protein
MLKKIKIKSCGLLIVMIGCFSSVSRSANDSVYIMTDTAYAQNLISYGGGASVTIQALQGIVNRNKSKMFISFNFEDNHDKDWMALVSAENNLKSTKRNDLKWYLQHFKDSLSGYILFDFSGSLPTSANLSLGIAGLLNAIPIDPNNANLITLAQSLGLTQVEDTRGKDYNWLHGSTYWPLFNKNEIMMLNPALTTGTGRDYGVARKMAFFYDYTPSDPNMTIMNMMCSSQNPGSRVYGWGYTDANISEAAFVATASNLNIGLIALDFARNISFYQHFNPSKPIANNPMPALPTNKKKHYVAVIMSDGDNPQAIMNKMTAPAYGLYGSPLRGQVPVGWSVPPTMYEYANPIMHYLTNSVTPNDVFIAGCNGWSYYFPSVVHNTNLFSAINDQTFSGSDLHYMVDLDFTTTFKGFTNKAIDPFTSSPQIKGIAFNDYNWAHRYDSLLCSNDKPVVATLSMGFTQPSNIEYTNIANYINAKPANSNAFSGFTLIYAQLWATTMNDLVNLKNALDTDVVMVRPDVLFELLKNQCATATGTENIISQDKYIHCFPNPSSGNFTLETSIQLSATTTCEIYNLLGEKIMDKNIENEKTEIDLSAYPKGIYFVRIASEGTIFTDKIIIQ